MPAATYVGYVIARTPNPETFDTIVKNLESQGFDRAQFSAIMRDESAEAVETDIDRQQIRVLGTSLGATAAGLAGAGLVAVATGGMALPAIAAGVTAAGGVAALSEAVGLKHEQGHAEWMASQAADGGIILHISVRDADQRAAALAMAKQHCGTAAFCDQTSI